MVVRRNGFRANRLKSMAWFAPQPRDIAGLELKHGRILTDRTLPGEPSGAMRSDSGRSHRLAQIGLAHLRIGADLVRPAGGDGAAVDQDRNPVRDREDRVHVMFY